MSGSARFEVVQGMLDDPQNRLCIDYINALRTYPKIYPPPLKTRDGAVIVCMALYVTGQQFPDKITLGRLEDAQKPAVRIYEVVDGYDVNVLSLGEDVTLGPFATLNEAIEEAKTFLHDTEHLTVSDHAPWI